MEFPLPANSRVTVQCTDPSGVFNAFDTLLSQRLPLRNLYWKSPTRPLRAINSLHVTLEQAKYGQTETQPNERRHQIPGLRQTPYLKIYLLRCDDKETYKSICRKQIREWIKAETQQSDNKSSTIQESHDAFEYLIVHVVLPNTPAASEPRISKNAGLENASPGPTDSSDSINSSNKSKWPGKGSSTVYDKIRADFNGSSKAALERVAQVRITRDVPQQPNLLPALGPLEVEEQWQDLVEKLKISILSSFDRRVRQYEADIRERDSQRNLPGWNFCTFFILKEGLARGFESVGLLDDALAGYDELAAGLDGIVREEAVQTDDAQSATFLPFSKDLKSKIRSVIEGPQVNGAASASSKESFATDETILQLDESMYPLDQKKKPYRELILSNDISVFDLRTYIFIRQAELLLHRANLSSHTTRIPNSAGSATNLANQEESFLHLAQICKRAMEFINLAAQTLRRELYLAWGGHDSQDLTRMNFQKSVIDNIVSSWIYCAAIQLLNQTSNPGLVIPTQSITTKRPQSSTASSRNSLIKQAVAPVDGSPDNRENQQQVLSHEPYSLTLDSNGLSSSQLQLESMSGHSNPSRFKNASAQELASWRAELFLHARKTIESQGRLHGWIPDINRLTNLYTELHGPAFEEVPLSDNKETVTTSRLGDVFQSTTLGLEPPIVERAARSQDVFSTCYENLTSQAYGHCVLAGQVKSTNRTLTDMALLKYEQEDYNSAASYFEQIADAESIQAWNVLHGSILEVYADCLKRLKRLSTYVRVILRILALYAADRRYNNAGLDRSQVVQALVDDVCLFSPELDDQVIVPMSDFVRVTSAELCIRHHEGKDGFYIPLSVCNLLRTQINISNGVKMVLTARDGPRNVVELHTDQSIQLTTTTTEVALESNVTTSGWYEPRRIEMIIGNIVLLEDVGEAQASQAAKLRMRSTDASILQKPVLLYPPVGAFQAKAIPPRKIHLPQPRSMRIELSSGWNDVGECTMRLKAATAGLRLQVRKAVMLDNAAPKGVKIREGVDNQSISLSHMPAYSTCAISLPYTLENADVLSLVARIEITYITEHGSYTYLDSVSLNTILPIKVNVEDLFQETSSPSRVDIALISRLTISPATLVPLRVEKCEIVESNMFNVESGADHAFPMDVFPKQPASMVYRFVRRKPVQAAVKEQSLTVSIDYHCLDEVVLGTVESQFSTSIGSSQWAALARPMSAHLLHVLRSQWTQEDLEVACLLQEVEVWSYEDIGWSAVCAGLPRVTRCEVEKWLRTWHDGHSSISLAHTETTKRQISIPVDIPAPRVLLTITLALTDSGDGKLPIAIGQPLIATLRVRHTRRWEEEPVEVQSKAMDFCYEVMASPETWLVGGRRRGNFSVDVAERQQNFSVLLIPQRAGHLLLPSVEVKCNTPDVDNSRTGLPKGQVAFEVNYKSHAKSVLVIPNLRETTVVLDTEAAGGKGLLVDSKKRTS